LITDCCIYVLNALEATNAHFYLKKEKMPRLRTKFGERAFSHAGTAAWNALPPDLRNIPVSTTFKRQLKTHFFKIAYNLL
jgi:hypothetical protein